MSLVPICPMAVTRVVPQESRVRHSRRQNRRNGEWASKKYQNRGTAVKKKDLRGMWGTVKSFVTNS